MPRAQWQCLKIFGTGHFRGNRRCRRLIATRANGQPAFGVYRRDPHAALMHANGLIVLTLAGDHICAITRFDNSVLARFGLPRSLPLTGGDVTPGPLPSNQRGGAGG